MSEEKRDPMDGEYVGNIFGWRVSIIGAIVITILIILSIIRFGIMGIEPEFEDTGVSPRTEKPVE